MTRASLRITLGLAALALTLAACEGGGGTQQGAAPQGELTEQDAAGMRIAAPGRLTAISPRSAAYQAAAADPSVDSLELYQHTNFGFSMAVQRVRYKPDVQVTLDEAVEQMMAGAGQRPGVENVTFTTSADTVSGRVGTRLSGSYDQPGGSGVMEILVVVEKNTLWTVQVIFDAQHARGPQLAEQILDSVQIL